jgi:REP element-mobilizing transposase RayT
VLHKNSPKRIYEDGGVYFVTSKTKDNFPFFREKIFCELWIEELKFCKELKNFQLFGFCLLPDHFHLVFRANEKSNFSKVMQSFKRNFTRDINRVLFGFKQNTVGAIPESRRIEISRHKTSENMDFRLRSLDDLTLKLHEWRRGFLKKHGTNHHFSKFQWQKSFYDHLIGGNRDFENCLDYTIENFRKHGLSGNWRYTSLNYPDLIDAS